LQVAPSRPEKRVDAVHAGRRIVEQVARLRMAVLAMVLFGGRPSENGS
jgi:hypothetical protein